MRKRECERERKKEREREREKGNNKKASMESVHELRKGKHENTKVLFEWFKEREREREREKEREIVF